MPASLPVAFSLMPNTFGMEGPVISASRMPTFFSSLCMETARREVTRLFPTPPLPDTTAITFFTSESAFGASMKLCGFCLLSQSTPQLLQSCVHSLILYVPPKIVFYNLIHVYLQKIAIIRDEYCKQDTPCRPKPEFRQQFQPLHPCPALCRS